MYASICNMCNNILLNHAAWMLLALETGVYLVVTPAANASKQLVGIMFKTPNSNEKGHTYERCPEPPVASD